MYDDETLKDLSLAGKIILITGSSRGIGAGIAIKLAQAEATVVLNYKDPESLNDASAVMSTIKNAGGNAYLIKADVSIDSEVKNMMEKVKEKFGRIDALVNNAGIIRDHTIENMTELEWNSVLNVNLKGVWLCSKYAIMFFYEESKIWQDIKYIFCNRS